MCHTCLLLGYSHNHTGVTYRMYNMASKKAFNTRYHKWADWHGNVKPTADMDEEFDTPPDKLGGTTPLLQIILQNLLS